MKTLTSIQEDALKELGSVGAAKAASALAQLLKTTIRLSEPVLRVETLQELWNEEERSEQVIAVIMGITGDATGHVVVAFEREHAIEFSMAYLSRFMPGVTPSDDDIVGTVQEFGNILAGPYLMALTTLTNLDLGLEPPTVLPGTRHDVLAALPDEVKNCEAAIVGSRFLSEDRDICGEVILVPSEGSFLNLLDSFSRKMAAPPTASSP